MGGWVGGRCGCSCATRSQLAVIQAARARQPASGGRALTAARGNGGCRPHSGPRLPQPPSLNPQDVPRRALRPVRVHQQALGRDRHQVSPGLHQESGCVQGCVAGDSAVRLHLPPSSCSPRDRPPCACLSPPTPPIPSLLHHVRPLHTLRPGAWVDNPNITVFSKDNAIRDGQIAVCISGFRVFVICGQWARTWLETKGAASGRGGAEGGCSVR